jgi:hypothetical protein
MKESYAEGPAIHGDPESCAAIREGSGEALIGAHAGRVFSLEKDLLWGADAVRLRGRPHLRHRNREMTRSPTWSETPCTYGNTLRENREIPCPPDDDGMLGRVGKSKDVRQR